LAERGLFFPAAKGENRMSLASDIAPHLPFLRRFSRALTGHQQSGDAYVAALLEAIIADTNGFDIKPDVRTAIYRSFCSLWESVSLNLQPGEQQGWEASATEHMAAMPPKAREAFLLMAVEGFTATDIGHILRRDPSEVSKLIDQASQSIVTRVATDVLVIEDEPIIAMDIEALLDSLGHKVIGVARTEAEALRIAAKKKPGLVLADIQLADGSSGIDAVNKILRNFQVPVIFITAFPERLLTGEKPEPAFLITKPFVPEMVKAVVSQALFFDTKSQIAA
jgi:CheY-like chemotaxis protein